MRLRATTALLAVTALGALGLMAAPAASAGDTFYLCTTYNDYCIVNNGINAQVSATFPSSAADQFTIYGSSDPDGDAIVRFEDTSASKGNEYYCLKDDPSYSNFVVIAVCATAAGNALDEEFWTIKPSGSGYDLINYWAQNTGNNAAYLHLDSANSTVNTYAISAAQSSKTFVWTCPPDNDTGCMPPDS